MKTSISTLKVNQKAQKAVDGAESSIKRFAGFIKNNQSKLNEDQPPESQIQKAANFIKCFLAIWNLFFMVIFLILHQVH